MFWTYEKNPNGKGDIEYIRRDSAVLPRHFASYVGGKWCGKECTWSLSDAELIHEMGLTPNHAVIIDLKPGERGNVSLYEVKQIWGVTSESWTPLAFHLRAPFVDHNPSPRTPDEFKAKFTVHGADPQDDVFEFLYCRHANLQTWYWGRVGMTNGALLWPNVFAYFSSEIQRAMSQQGISARPIGRCQRDRLEPCEETNPSN